MTRDEFYKCRDCDGRLQIDFALPTLDMYPVLHAFECPECGYTCSMHTFEDALEVYGEVSAYGGFTNRPH